MKGQRSSLRSFEIKRRRALLAITVFSIVGGFLFPSSSALCAPDLPAKEVRVGVFNCPPFAMKTTDGAWEGIAVDIWMQVAERTGLSSHLKEFEFAELLTAVEEGAVDVGVGSISVTAEREEAEDFSQPFYLTGLGIAVCKRDLRTISVNLLDYLLASRFLLIIGPLLLLSLVSGMGIWMVERKRNPQEFRPGIRGVIDGMWWATVTVTTVGYGEKTPKSAVGRLIAVTWMLIGIVILALVTAAITSTITINEMGYKIAGPQDLDKAIVGTMRNTTAEDYLKRHDIQAVLYNGIEEALDALVAGEIGAAVLDRPRLRYFQKNESRGRIDVLRASFASRPTPSHFLWTAPCERS